MARAGRALVFLLALLAPATAWAADPPQPWDGVNPFSCVLQQAGMDGTGPNPEADPYCIEFDKRRQNVTQLGLVEFVSKEPERVAVASPKCFYFQSDHWRGSIAQDVPGTKTYEYDGHYFFDKAKGEGGVWVTNFNIAGQTGDPRVLPGFPAEYKPFFGPGTGGFRTRNSIDADPRCVERAKREGGGLYGGRGSGSSCISAAGPVTARRLGPLRLGDGEGRVRRTLGPPLRVKRGFLRWCTRDRARYLVGQRSDRSGELGESAGERTVMLIASSGGLRYRGVGPRARLATLRRRLRGERRVLRQGSTSVYVTRRGSAILFGVRRGRVRYVAVRNTRRVRGARALARYLRRAG